MSLYVLSKIRLLRHWRPVVHRIDLNISSREALYSPKLIIQLSIIKRLKYIQCLARRPSLRYSMVRNSKQLSRSARRSVPYIYQSGAGRSFNDENLLKYNQNKECLELVVRYI